GDLQQLLFVPDPAAAARYCQDYMPDCNRQLIYKLQTQDAEENIPQRKGKKGKGKRRGKGRKKGRGKKKRNKESLEKSSLSPTSGENEIPTDISPMKAATEFWEKDPDAELGILTSTTMTANFNLTHNYEDLLGEEYLINENRDLNANVTYRAFDERLDNKDYKDYYDRRGASEAEHYDPDEHIEPTILFPEQQPNLKGQKGEAAVIEPGMVFEGPAGYRGPQ
ncbi:hypothetical protein E2320_016806, partial [Naja naja]